MTPTPPQMGQDGHQPRVSQRQGVGLAVETPEPERQPVESPVHTFGKECGPCSTPAVYSREGRRLWARCDHSGYSIKTRRFVDRHRHVYVPLLTDSDSRAAGPELERLAVELKLTPDARGHSGLCPGECPMEDLRKGIDPCWECRRARREYARWLEKQEPMEQGRGGHVNAPMPPTLLLDYVAGHLGRLKAA